MRMHMRKNEWFDWINQAGLILITLLVLYPLIYILSASFSDPDTLYTGEMWLWPKGFTLDGYRRILAYKDLWMGYRNTIFYAVVGTLMNLSVTLPCAYALSRKDFVGRNIFMTMFLVTMYISGGLIPSYLNLRDLGLLDSRMVILISGLTSTYNIIVSRTFFSSTIPLELQESATIDGCSNFGIFVKIVLPLSKAIIAVMTLYFALGRWNDYFNAMIVLRNRSLYPLQLFLREILVQSQISAEMLEGVEADMIGALLQKQKVANLLKYGVIIVSSLPLLMVYPFLQRYFVQGVLIGSIKA
jgi:putative aldouronate transport system permease protein